MEQTTKDIDRLSNTKRKVSSVVKGRLSKNEVKMLADKISGERTPFHWEINGENKGITFGFYTDYVFLPDKKDFFTKFSAENVEYGLGKVEKGYCMVMLKGENIKTEKEWDYNPDQPKSLAKSVTVE